MKKILGKLRRAIQDFNMIQDNDRIAVGLSGGKDSMLLLKALKQYQRFSPEKFELMAITINMGLKGYDPEPLYDYCRSIDVRLKIIDTQIGKLIFEIRKESNPCSLCANMRRGALHNAVKDEGFNKIALGHHKNDVIETFLMSLFFESRISTFSPVTYLDRKDLFMIRPMIYIDEHEIKGEVKKLHIPIVKNPCPANGFTQRENMKQLIKTLQLQNHDIEEHIMSAIMNTDQLNVWDREAIKKICVTKQNC